MVNNYLIVGADSELARAFVKANLNKNNKIFKISRNDFESDIEIKDYIKDFRTIINYAKKIPHCYVIFFNGFLVENRPTQHPSTEEITATYKINFQIPFFLTQKMSQLENIEKYVYISSIAAVKPRYKNYIYGNAKNMLEKSISDMGLKNILFLRFGKIKTKMSADHKDLVFTLNKENAAELIYRNLKKTGITYPNFELLLISFVLKLLPSRLLNYIEKSLS